MWECDLRTRFCCQESRPGLASIAFFTTLEAAAFLVVSRRNYPVEVTGGFRWWGDRPEANLVLSVFFPVEDIPHLIEAFKAEVGKGREGKMALAKAMTELNSMPA
jgi:hypothetical protein